MSELMQKILASQTEINRWNDEARESRPKPTPTATEQQKTKKTKTLKMALNLVCPIGTVAKPYAEIKEQVEDTFGIHLNEVPRTSLHHARTELGIKIVAVNPGLWSRPSAAKEEL
ncbi:MAG TPA: hypothetical protein VFQ43_22680 [Nitrososphaera sp.]|nr:hypothetical protein [Nitrososphaera sp.]